jgi:hypothetical protein
VGALLRTFVNYRLKQFYNIGSRKEQFKEQNNLTEPDDCDRWSLYNSIFFSFTAMTTIG